MSDPAKTETTVDRYILEEPLGKGGFSTVYRARHSLIGNKVAFKLLAAKHTKNRVTIERFLREAQTAASIGNPHIVKVLDCGTSLYNEMFLVMELLEGLELTKIIEREAPIQGERALHIILQVLDGLAAAHSVGIVHRDIKPANIFLTKAADGTNSFVKLLDFGISKILDSSADALTSAGEVLGTPMYMAPEQIMGADKVDHRCDLYAVSAVLYHMLTGRLPHDAVSLAQLAHMLLSETPVRVCTLNPSVPAELDAIIMKGLAREPDNRWYTANDLATALRPFCPNFREPSLPGTFPTGSMAQIPNAVEPDSELSSPGITPGYGTPPAGIIPAYGEGQNGAISTGPLAPAPVKKKLPLWLLFIGVGVTATLLGGITVTIASFAMRSLGPERPVASGPVASPNSGDSIVPVMPPAPNPPLSPASDPPALNPPPTTGLRFGYPTMGTLPYGQRMDYPLQIQRPTMVTISAQSSAFDTYLYLLNGDVVLNSDDDGGEGLNSRLVMYLGPGTYTVRVGSYMDTGSGQFVLHVFQNG